MEKFACLRDDQHANTVASIDRYIDEITSAIVCNRLLPPQQLPHHQIKTRAHKNQQRPTGEIQTETGHTERNQAIPRLRTTEAGIPQHHKGKKKKLEEEKRAAQMREVEALNPKDSQQYMENHQQTHRAKKANKKPIKLTNPSTNTTANSEKETADTFTSQLAKVLPQSSSTRPSSTIR